MSVSADQLMLPEPAGPAARSAEGQAAAAWGRSSARLTAAVALLSSVGLVMVVSAAGTEGFKDALLRRLAFTGLGAVAFVAAARTDYRWWRRHNLGVLAVALVALTAVLVPGVGARINGARRWTRPILGLGLQPSEFAKVALCIWVAAYCERNITRMRSFAHGFVAPLSVVGVAALLVLAEPDFGTSVLMAGVCLTVLLVCGTRLVYVLLAGAAGLPLLQRLILDVPYRMKRVLAFLDPWSDPRGAGYQLIQSKIAIGSGGLAGVGLGAGQQKAGFLPGAPNDFIFSVLAEELGFIGCALLILLFVLLLWEGLKIVLRSRDPFGFALGLGLSWLLAAQAAAHIAVVTGSVPTKGLSLPFISAGGSSLVASLWAAGLLVSIARSEEEPERYPHRPWEAEMPRYERWACRAMDSALRAAARLAGRGPGVRG